MRETEKNYYAQGLHSEKLHQVYQTKIPEVLQYFDAEIEFIRGQMRGNEKVLELGAGYGRVMKKLAPHVGYIVGIDISRDTVDFGKKYLKDVSNTLLKVMDANKLDLEEKFDVVLCLQNGLSAMKNEGRHLVDQALSVLSGGGKAYFSSYSPKFWAHRLAWFQEQAAKGLLGEIDLEKTKNGIIICKDGFMATTHTEEDFRKLGESTRHEYHVEEVDRSSVFLVIKN